MQCEESSQGFYGFIKQPFTYFLILFNNLGWAQLGCANLGRVYLCVYNQLLGVFGTGCFGMPQLGWFISDITWSLILHQAMQDLFIWCIAKIPKESRNLEGF